MPPAAAASRPSSRPSSTSRAKPSAPKKANIDKANKAASKKTEAPKKDDGLNKVREGKEVLVKGDKGADVKAAQTLLNKTTKSELKTDGDYGKQTEAAVRDFQKAQNIKNDGKLGAQTMSALDKASAKQDANTARQVQKAAGENARVTSEAAAPKPEATAKKGLALAPQPDQGSTVAPGADEMAMAQKESAPYVGETVKAGESGEDVSKVQTKLNELGYQTGKVDGKFGKNTQSAVQKFQSDQGLKSDGVVGKNTYAKLGIKAEAPAAPAAPGDASDVSKAFKPNAQAVAKGAKTSIGKQIANKVPQNAELYKAASAKTGVPASIIAAIHGQESGYGTSKQSVNGPESGFGLDPRYVSNKYGNQQLAKHGLGKWQRGVNNEKSKLQSAVIAAEHFKRNAKQAGVTVGNNMSRQDVLLSTTSYVAGANSRITKNARRNGKSFLFNPSDSNPHPYHPGGTSIGSRGQTIRVRPGYKQGLLRWDVMLPLIENSLN